MTATPRTLADQVKSILHRLTKLERRITATGGTGGGSTVVDGIPVGMAVWYPSTQAPSSAYMLANGAAVSRTAYTALYSALGTTFGAGDGSTTFNLPNLQGKVPAGQLPSDSVFGTMGQSVGEAKHTLATTELPAHSHGVTDPAHAHPQVVTNPVTSGGTSGRADYNSDSTDMGTYAQGVTTSAATTGISIQNAGGGAAHNNVQPTVIGAWWIKVLGAETSPDKEFATLAVVGQITQNGGVNVLDTSVYAQLTPIFTHAVATKFVSNSTAATAFGGTMSLPALPNVKAWILNLTGQIGFNSTAGPMRLTLGATTGSFVTAGNVPVYAEAGQWADYSEVDQLNLASVNTAVTITVSGQSNVATGDNYGKFTLVATPVLSA